MKWSPTDFQNQMLWELSLSGQFPHVWGAWYGVCSSPSSLLAGSLHLWWVWPEVWFPTGFHPSYCFWCDLFSMTHCGESFLPVFGLFSVLVALLWLLLSVVMEPGDLRVLLLCHLPRLPLCIPCFPSLYVGCNKKKQNSIYFKLEKIIFWAAQKSN